ncbi:MAG: transcriptional regulator [Candidatus Bathyarchaeota archaeon]|nr:transcriptional regulator [Candidatus Bathyarchaeota archaeon]
MSKDQALGLLIFIACVIIAIAYTAGLFLPTFEGLRFWIVAIPVFVGFVVILAIGAWIGWTMATTPPPEPIEELTGETGEKQSAEQKEEENKTEE